ncbi:MAG: putative porin [Deltaproteobacteria bacterium]|nr:putative porin [Deltaproteobacteria bacterium]
MGRAVALGVLRILLVIVSLTLSALEATAKDLGDVLLQKGLITKDELDQARAEEKQKQAADESRLDAFRAKLPQWLDRITLFGDLRLRHEGFYQEDLHARNRFRLRGRLGLTANISEEVSGNFRLATGNPGDPISTNQTVDSVFSRKSINLDWAYLTLKPGKSLGIEPGWFSLTAGKFGITTYHLSELVWDDDVSPEGASETLNLVEQREGVVRGLRVNAFQWIVDEVSDGSDPWIPGGQVIGDASLGGEASWSLAFADYYFDHSNLIARKFLNQFTDPPTNSKANSSFNSQLANSNSVVKDANGKILRYQSGFNVLNATTELNAANPIGLGVPAGIFADVAYNTQADGHNVGMYVGAGIGKAGKDWYHNTLKNQGDWGLSYTYAWVEKDAVLSIFSFSDINEFSTAAAKAGSSRPTQKGGTNLSAHILRADYVLLPYLQLTAKAYVEDALDRKISNAALTGNPTLLRTQLDATLRF